MKSIISLLICTCILHSVFGQTKKRKELNLHSGLYSTFVEGEQVEARILGLGVGAEGFYRVNKSTKVKVDFGALLDSGSTKSVNTNEFRVRQGFDLREAKLVWSPWQVFGIEAGVLNQRLYQSPLLLGSVGMPAAREIITFEGKHFSLILRAEQAIPNNNTLATRVGSVQEGTPSLLQESAEIKYKDDWNKFRLLIGRFQFSELSSNVAYESQFLGNSVTGVGVNNAAFAYEFSGYNAMVHYKGQGDSLGFEVQGNYSHNKKAPKGRSDSFSVLAGLHWEKCAFFGKLFKNESDASAGFYNSKMYGHNNREGFSASFEYRDADKWLGSITYTKADLVRSDNIFQDASTIASAHLTYFWNDIL